MVWLLFKLHYLFDNTSNLELHSCIWCVNSGINLFSLSIHICSTLKLFCVVHHCVRQCVIARAWSVWLNRNFVNFMHKFCTFLRLCWNCFAVTYVCSSCFIRVHYAVIFIVLRSAEIVHFVTGNFWS